MTFDDRWFGNFFSLGDFGDLHFTMEEGRNNMQQPSWNKERIV